MNLSMAVILETLILTSALSLDALVSGFAYGTNRIKIPFSSLMVINLICTIMLTLSLFAGRILHSLMPEDASTWICFLMLFVLGLIKLFDGLVKSLIQRMNGINKDIKFHFARLRFILNVYAAPEMADIDESQSLSPMEAASLAVALSLDSIAVGIGAGLKVTNSILIIVLSFFVNAAAVMGGCSMGNKIAQKVAPNLSWIGGVLLIILAFTKL